MVLATLALLFQAPAVPVATEGVAKNPAAPTYYAANMADERTSLASFQPAPAATTSPAPSRFQDDGIRLLNLMDDDGNKVKVTSDQPVFPDETSKILSSVHIPPQFENLPPLNGRHSSVMREGHKWLFLTLAQSSAATFDAWTTNRAVGYGHSELNPILRPVAGSPAIYAAVQVTPILFDYIGRKMQHSENGMMRRIWWVPQVLGTATSLGAGIHNLAVTH